MAIEMFAGMAGGFQGFPGWVVDSLVSLPVAVIKAFAAPFVAVTLAASDAISVASPLSIGALVISAGSIAGTIYGLYKSQREAVLKDQIEANKVRIAYLESRAHEAEALVEQREVAARKQIRDLEARIDERDAKVIEQERAKLKLTNDNLILAAEVLKYAKWMQLQAGTGLTPDPDSDSDHDPDHDPDHGHGREAPAPS